MGPASSKKNTLRDMMRAGMDIARFNFSHGSHEEHRGRVDMVKNLREELNIPVALLLDTKGPEIRTKLLKDHKKITLEAGSEFTLTTGDIEGDETRVAITYENLYKDVKKGGKILIDDGLIELEIENIKNGDIVCRVLNGGELGERKGINVPYVNVKLPGITEQDKDDILLIEGIHALNPALTPNIPAANKFKIYVSALTTIQLDYHNYIPTTDNRLLRRIIRDYKYRNYSAEETIARWGSVRAGEDKWIFPYQEYADAMFNSALLFELAVLKDYVEPILRKVPNNSSEYSEAHRLLRFLSYFVSVRDKELPPTSLLREFLGGSSFRY